MCILSKYRRKNLIDELDIDTQQSEIILPIILEQNVCSKLPSLFSKQNYFGSIKITRNYDHNLVEISRFASTGTVVERTINFNVTPYFSNANQITSQGVILIIPYGYPLVFFNDKNLNEILEFFQVSPNFVEQYSIVECGRVKIMLVREMTAAAINDILRDIAFIPANSTTQYPLVSIPKETPPACIELSCFIPKWISETKFLTSIKDQFKTTSSKWTCNDVSFLSKNVWVLNFSTDPESYIGILTNDRKMSICGNQTNVIDGFNPFKLDMKSFALQKLAF